MKKLYYLPLIILFLSSCSGSSYNGRYSDGEPSELQERIEELEYELDEANNKIADYASRLDNIQLEASNGYDAICYFNWSYQLQEALDAFENIQSEANY